MQHHTMTLESNQETSEALEETLKSVWSRWSRNAERKQRSQPKFKPLEQISIKREPESQGKVFGTTNWDGSSEIRGTVVWLDLIQTKERPWLYLIEAEAEDDALPRLIGAYEDTLESQEQFATPYSVLGTQHQVSFDTASGCEGYVRRPGTFYECFVLLPPKRHQPPPDDVIYSSAAWGSGITGHAFVLPDYFEIERSEALTLELLHRFLGMDDILLHHGVDSLSLK